MCRAWCNIQYIKGSRQTKLFVCLQSIGHIQWRSGIVLFSTAHLFSLWITTLTNDHLSWCWRGVTSDMYGFQVIKVYKTELLPEMDVKFSAINHQLILHLSAPNFMWISCNGAPATTSDSREMVRDDWNPVISFWQMARYLCILLYSGYCGWKKVNVIAVISYNYSS